MVLRFNPRIFMYQDMGESSGGNGNGDGNGDGQNQNPEPANKEGLLANANTEDNGNSSQENQNDDKAAPAGVAERPDYIAEQFWNIETGEAKVEDLSKSYNNLRNEYNKLQQGKPQEGLEKAEDYLQDFAPPVRFRPKEGEKEGELLERYGDLDPSDPVFLAVAKFAKKGNMSKDQFGEGMQELLEDLHSVLPEPFDAEKEKAILGEAGEIMIDTNRKWIDALVKNGVINEDEYNLLLGFGGSALGVQLTNKLRLNSGEKPIPTNLNGNANTGRKTPAECQAMMADERYSQEGPVGDAYRAEVDKAFAETYGTDPA